MTETYEGWTNRETWAVALWINNDQGMQESVHEIIAELTDELGESLIVKVDWTPTQAREAGAAVQEWLNELFDAELHDGILPRDVILMMQDIGSMWRVNWAEIGRAFLQDASRP